MSITIEEEEDLAFGFWLVVQSFVMCRYVHSWFQHSVGRIQYRVLWGSEA